MPWASAALATTLGLDVGRIEHPDFVIDGLRMELAPRGRSTELAADRVAFGDREWRNLRLKCPEFRLADGELRCNGGRLALPGIVDGAVIDLTLNPGRRSGSLRLRPGEGEEIRADVDEGGRLRVQAEGLDLGRLAGLWPQAAAYSPGGRLDVRGEWKPENDGGRLQAEGALRGGAFSSAGGLQAGEGLELGFDFSAENRQGGWTWRSGLSWRAGEAYLHPVYLTAGPSLEAHGEFSGGRLEVTDAVLSVDGVRSIAASAVVDVAAGRLERAALAVAEADLAIVGPRYLAPILAPAQVDALRFAGTISAGVTLEGGELVAVDAAFNEAGFAVEGKGLSFGPLSGEIPWRRDESTHARLDVGGGRWGRLWLEGFELGARLQGDVVDVARVRIPVLDGALVLHDLALRRSAGGWEGRGGVVVEPIAMADLTAALSLPAMSGTLAASLPGLSVAPGLIALDGALVIAVFDGYVQLTGLRVFEPFGAASHAYADVEARRLDLAQLTQTFDFGSIIGYLDADVRGLELVRWQPVRFDARVASSPGRYPRRISQRAVENISSLGGSGAVAAIQRSFLRFFETFGYSEIGLSCMLQDGVCLMGGIGGTPDDPAGGFRLVRGGGIPALNVIGYNRRVDWNELIDRLQQAIASNAAPVVR